LGELQMGPAWGLEADFKSATVTHPADSGATAFKLYSMSHAAAANGLSEDRYGQSRNSHTET
jgi:hypothetical protein